MSVFRGSVHLQCFFVFLKMRMPLVLFERDALSFLGCAVLAGFRLTVNFPSSPNAPVLIFFTAPCIYVPPCFGIAGEYSPANLLYRFAHQNVRGTQNFLPADTNRVLFTSSSKNCYKFCSFCYKKLYKIT